MGGTPVSTSNKKQVHVHSGKKLKSFSIKKLASSNNTSQPTVARQKDSSHKPVETEIDPSWRNDFTPEQLQRVWSNYAHSVEAQNPRLFSMLTAHTPRLKGEHVVVFPLQNETQEVELMREKRALLNFLRRELKNAGVLLEVEYVREDLEPTKAYTASDKYKLLAEKNPVLNKLKDALNLDLE